LRALVFGDREPALKPVSDDFSTTGTTHLLAANGMRVAMVAGLVYLVCRLLQVPPRRTVTVATVCVIAFGLVTMPVSQSIRPVIVCAAIGAALASRRVTDSVQMLALAAIAVLVIRPLDLYGAGFQLSFIIVLALILLTRPAIAFIASLEDEDRRVARSFAPRTRRRMRRERTRKWAVGFLVAAAVGWAAAVPLVAFHFEQFNLWTVPFTILLSPLAVLAIGAGFAKLILTAVCPPLAGAWAVMAAVPASWLGHAVAWLAKVPGADLPVGSPPLWVSIVFYAMLCLPLLQWVNKRARWWARCAPLGGLAALILVPVWTARVTEGPGPGGLKITLLGVGAGQCAVVETGGKTVVLDAGSSTFSDPYRSCIAPFLRHEGCVRVDELWLSHGDFDHVGAAQQLVAGYGVKEVLASPHLRRLSHESRPCQELLAELDQTKHSPRLVTKGDSIQVGPTTLEVLWPPPDSNFNTNNTGVVLKVACAGRSVLFPADIQDLAEKELLKHRELLTADVLVAPHHGSEERTTRQFVDAVHPRAIVSSNGETLSMKQRSFDADVRGVPSFRTSRYGAITIEVRADGAVRITSYREGRLLEIKR
jgi:competence protein ComEC